MKYLGLITLLFSLSACSSWFKTKPDEKPVVTTPPPAVEDIVPQNNPNPEDSKPLTDNIASPMAEPIQNETVDVTLNRPSYIDDKYSPDSSSATSLPEKSESSSYKKQVGIDPDKALGWLSNGNKRFLRGALRADGQKKKDIQRLAKSQKPHAIVFSSSDSRLPPEIIFDEKLGEIYVVRNLALTVDPSVINSIDYAVGELGTRLIVVLDRTYPGKQIDFGHADETTQKLVDQSAIIKSALEAKALKIVPAIYDIESGKVTFSK
jgi:carbonic anhydrase